MFIDLNNWEIAVFHNSIFKKEKKVLNKNEIWLTYIFTIIGKCMNRMNILHELLHITKENVALELVLCCDAALCSLIDVLKNDLQQHFFLHYICLVLPRLYCTANRSFSYIICVSEHVSKVTVCQAIRKFTHVCGVPKSERPQSSHGRVPQDSSYKFKK